MYNLYYILYLARLKLFYIATIALSTNGIYCIWNICSTL